MSCDQWSPQRMGRTAQQGISTSGRNKDPMFEGRQDLGIVDLQGMAGMQRHCKARERRMSPVSAIGTSWRASAEPRGH
jgi:hypothetical protein